MSGAILTMWLCLASHPQCDVKDDPTGPPIIHHFETKAECEGAAASNMKIPVYNESGRLTPRYTCEPAGVDL